MKSKMVIKPNLSPGDFYTVIAPLLWKMPTEDPVALGHLNIGDVVLFVGFINEHLCFISKYGVIWAHYLEAAVIAKASA